MTARKEKNEIESRYERYKDVINDLTIMDDVFMRNVFKQKECLEYVLQVIMEMKELQVIEHVIQKDFKNLQGRSAILDCVAKDARGKQFNVEIQQAKKGASPKRARYHGGLLDMNTLNPGEDFEKLPESYVIFITRNDTLGYGLPIYHIKKKIEEVNADFQDGAHIIYVNSGRQDDTELGRLMHDLHCKDADEMYSDILARRVRELKEEAKGEDIMSEKLQELCEESYNEGELKKAKEIAFALAEEGMEIGKIARLVKVDVEDVQQWIDKNMSVTK